jgi:hypothetical protein
VARDTHRRAVQDLNSFCFYDLQRKTILPWIPDSVLLEIQGRGISNTGSH